MLYEIGCKYRTCIVPSYLRDFLRPVKTESEAILSWYHFFHK